MYVWYIIFIIIKKIILIGYDNFYKNIKLIQKKKYIIKAKKNIYIYIYIYNLYMYYFLSFLPTDINKNK